MQYYLKIIWIISTYSIISTENVRIDRQNCLKKELLFFGKTDGYWNSQHGVIYIIEFKILSQQLKELNFTVRKIS